MAKKKLRYPKRRRQIVTAVVVFVLFVAALSTSLILYNKDRNSYAAVFDSKRIPMTEFKFYVAQQKGMYEQIFGGRDFWKSENGVQFGDSLKSSAVNDLLSNKIVAKKATEMNISLTEEEKAEVQKNFEEFKTSYVKDNPLALEELGTTDEQMLNTMTEISLSQKLFEEITKDYVLDESAFQTAYAQYQIDSIKDYTTVNVNYIKTDSLEKATQAKAQLEAGKSIKEVAKEFSLDYKEDDTAEFVELKETGLPQDVIDAAFDLKENEVSPVLTFADGTGFAVVLVHSKPAVDFVALEEGFKESYVTKEKEAMFQEKMNTWIEETTYSINEKAIIALDLTKF